MANILGNELGVELRLANLEDVDLHLAASAEFGKVIGHFFNLGILYDRSQALDEPLKE